MCGPYLIEIIDILSGDIFKAITTNGQQMQGTLQEINNQLQENNEAIQELTKGLLGSGESGEKGILEKIYEELFTISSGEAQEILENIIEETDLGEYSMISGEMQIINSLTGEPGDFIIKWGATNYQGVELIPSGEINFSEKVREIPELDAVLDWIHIIMGYTIIVLLMTDIWFTLLKMLGLATSIYDQANEEAARTEDTITETYTEHTNYREINGQLVPGRKTYTKNINRTRRK